MLVQAGLPWEEDRQPMAGGERASADTDSAGSDDSDQEAVQPSIPSTSGRRPVWDDADDAAAEVNIAAQPRLRKLRKTERDGIVSGRHQTTCCCEAADCSSIRVCLAMWLKSRPAAGSP